MKRFVFCHISPAVHQSPDTCWWCRLVFLTPLYSLLTLFISLLVKEQDFNTAAVQIIGVDCCTPPITFEEVKSQASERVIILSTATHYIYFLDFCRRAAADQRNVICHLLQGIRQIRTIRKLWQLFNSVKMEEWVWLESAVTSLTDSGSRITTAGRHPLRHGLFIREGEPPDRLFMSESSSMNTVKKCFPWELTV